MRHVRGIQWCAILVGVIIIGVTQQLWIIVPLVICVICLEMLARSLESG